MLTRQLWLQSGRLKKKGLRIESPQISQRKSEWTATTRLALIAFSAIVMLLLPSCSSTPVEASCPPFPPLPQAVEQGRSTVGLSASPGIDYLKDSAKAFEDLLDDLREAFTAAQVPSPTSKPVPSGR